MQITVRTQGTMSIFNNGKMNISPGDTLLWKIPTSEDLKHIKTTHDIQGRYGRAPRKVTLMIEPMRAASYQASFKPVFSALGKQAHKESVVTVADEFALDIKKLVAYIAFLVDVPEKKRTYQNGKPPVVKFEDAWDLIQNMGTVSEIGTDGDTEQFAVGLVNMFGNLAKDENIGSFITKALSGFLKIQTDLDRRKVGKALSYSKTGQKVDVLLGCS